MVAPGGATLSLNSDANVLVVNSQTVTLAPPAPSGAALGPNIVIASQTVSPNSAGNYVISGQTLAPGGPAITVSNTVISLGPSASILVVNGQTETRPPVPSGPITSAPALTIDGRVFAPVPVTKFTVNGQTLTPGGVITVSGTTVSLGSGSSSTIVVVNGATSTLQPSSALTIAGSTFAPTVQTIGEYVIGGSTLRPGSAITVSGTTVSLASSDDFIVVNGVTSALRPGSVITTAPPLLTIGGTTYTANAGTSYTIDGQTLTPGGVITVSGTTVSLAPSATVLVVDGVPQTLFPAVITTTGSSSFTITTTTGRSQPTGGAAATTSSRAGSSTISSQLDGLMLRITMLIGATTALLTVFL